LQKQTRLCLTMQLQFALHFASLELLLFIQKKLLERLLNPLISLTNKNDKSLKTLETNLRLGLDFVMINDYI
jgi:hypothetical protein